MCNQYNGYANYPTWNVSLWIDNDQGMYAEVLERACDILESAYASEFSTRVQVANYELQEYLKELITDEHNPLAEDCNMYSDILGWALDCVNWHELAENWLELAEEELSE